jgi:hypothetical protein
LGETQVELSVIPTTPFTEIGGSALRAFSLTRNPQIVLVLDASSSIDFDQLAGEFTYQWYAFLRSLRIMFAVLNLSRFVRLHQVVHKHGDGEGLLG